MKLNVLRNKYGFHEIYRVRI